jgi:hypothetical protein
LAQAAALGHGMTSDPDLRIVVAGRTLSPTIAGSTWRTRLHSTVRSVRFVSRTWVPAHATADEDDTRLLGIAVTNIRLDGEAIALDDPSLTSGWHTAEQGWRWTNGDTRLRVANALELAFDVVITGNYWQASRQLKPMLPGSSSSSLPAAASWLSPGPIAART